MAGARNRRSHSGRTAGRGSADVDDTMDLHAAVEASCARGAHLRSGDANGAVALR